MSFWFKSVNFSAFAVHASRTGGKNFDPVLQRYRGLGLAMCRALAKTYRVRSDSLRDAILIAF